MDKYLMQHFNLLLFLMFLSSYIQAAHNTSTNDFTKALPTEIITQALNLVPLRATNDALRFLTLLSVNKPLHDLCLTQAYPIFKKRMDFIIRKYFDNQQFEPLLKLYKNSRNSVFAQRFCRCIIKHSSMLHNNSYCTYDNAIIYFIGLLRYAIKRNDVHLVRHFVNKKHHWLNASVLLPHFYSVNKKSRALRWEEWTVTNKYFEKYNSLMMCICRHNNRLFSLLFKFFEYLHGSLTTTCMYGGNYTIDMAVCLLCKSIKYHNHYAFITLYDFLSSCFKAQDHLYISFPYLYDYDNYPSIINRYDHVGISAYTLKEFLYIVLAQAERSDSKNIKASIEQYMKELFIKKGRYFWGRYINYRQLKILKKI